VTASRRTVTHACAPSTPQKGGSSSDGGLVEYSGSTYSSTLGEYSTRALYKSTLGSTQGSTRQQYSGSTLTRVLGEYSGETLQEGGGYAREGPPARVRREGTPTRVRPRGYAREGTPATQATQGSDSARDSHPCLGSQYTAQGRQQQPRWGQHAMLNCRRKARGAERGLLTGSAGMPGT